MKNEYKEIEHKLRESLELWSEVLTDSNVNGWGANLDFSDEDAINAASIMTTICANIGIKNGSIKTEKDAERIGKNIHHILENDFNVSIKNKNMK